MKIVKTKTSDGIFFNGLLSTPPSLTKKIIIHIHGMAGSPLLNEYYTAMHELYPTNGIAFLAVEHRGTGVITYFDSENGNSIIGNALERFEDCIRDIQAWIEFAHTEGYEEIWLQSHSLGTSKVAYYLHEVQPTDIAGTIFLSPSDMIGLVHDPVGILDHKIMLPAAHKLISEGNGSKLIEHKLWGVMYLSGYTYVNFFDEQANTAIFNYGNETLGWNVVNSINIPVLAITGSKDDGIYPVMDPGEAMSKLEKELSSSPKIKTITYENAKHDFDGFGEQICHDVIDFVQSVSHQTNQLSV